MPHVDIPTRADLNHLAKERHDCAVSIFLPITQMEAAGHDMRAVSALVMAHHPAHHGAAGNARPAPEGRGDAMMDWRFRTALAGILGALGLYVMANPVGVTGLATSVIPWLLIGAGGIYILAIFLRSRSRPLTMILPGLVGALLLYAGLSMKFGDPASAGPIGLVFLFALLLFGSGIAKLLMASSMTRSRYFKLLLGSGALSAAMGLVVLFTWSGLSATIVGIVLGVELIADAIFLGALSLRDRDKEEAREALGLDPASEAAVAPSVVAAQPSARIADPAPTAGPAPARPIPPPVEPEPVRAPPPPEAPPLDVPVPGEPPAGDPAPVRAPPAGAAAPQPSVTGTGSKP